jgi:hypothetical protein
VTYRKEDQNIEIALVLPHPDVPLKLAAQTIWVAKETSRNAS